MAKSTQPIVPSTPRKRVSLFRLLLWLVALLFLIAYYPPSFRFVLREVAEYSAAKSGLRLNIGKVSGSLFEPVIFLNTTLSTASFADSEIHLAIARSEVNFSFKNLFFHRAAGCVSQLSIDGMDGEIVLPGDTLETVASGKTRPIPKWLLPASIQAKRMNLALHEKNHLVFFQNMECNASDVHAGSISIEKIHIAEPWLTKTFSDVRGTMALQNSSISVADMVLQKGMRLENASADLGALTRRRLKMTFTLLAFNGKIQGDLDGFTREKHHLNFQTNGSFSQISIPDLARFLGSRETTGGIIEDGHFSFYGSPSDLKQSKSSIRLSARDFLWGQRQWNSLVLGATLVDRDLQILNLELQQAHNTLNLTGKIAIPDSRANWLKTDFNFNLDAKLDNVTELSQLFGPDLAHTAGKALIHGSIRGEALSFTGDLSVSGSNLAYKTVPVDTLNASVRLKGDELQIDSFEITHQHDFVRGKGGATLLHDKKYWGEINASIGELSWYSALLQPPILPRPYSGGIVLQWSGDGTAKTHSGAFNAHLKNVRPAEKSPASPLNADLEGSYSPENIYFKKCLLSNSTASLTAVLAANPNSLSVTALQFKHGNELCLEGSALLPFNLWRAWQQWDDSCWTAGECKLELTAKKLDLHETEGLTGLKLPMNGVVDGKLSTSGSLSDLNSSGRISYSKGNLNPAPGVTLSEVTASLNGKIVTLESATGQLNSTGFTGSGDLNFTEFHDPTLQLSIHSKAVALELPAPLKANLDLHIDGPLSAANVTGSLVILEAELPADIVLFSPLSSAPHEFNFNPQFNLTLTPYAHWKIDLHCTAASPLKIGVHPGSVTPNLQVRGSDSHFITTGSLRFEHLKVPSPLGPVQIDAATLLLRPDHPGNPLICGRFSTKIADSEVSGYALGSFLNPTITLFSYPPIPGIIQPFLPGGFVMSPPQTGGFSEELPVDLQSSWADNPSKTADISRVDLDQDFSFATDPETSAQESDTDQEPE